LRLIAFPAVIFGSLLPILGPAFLLILGAIKKSRQLLNGLGCLYNLYRPPGTGALKYLRGYFPCF
jgi:hypothetical protein